MAGATTCWSSGVIVFRVGVVPGRGVVSVCICVSSAASAAVGNPSVAAAPAGGGAPPRSAAPSIAWSSPEEASPKRPEQPGESSSPARPDDGAPPSPEICASGEASWSTEDLLEDPSADEVLGELMTSNVSEDVELEDIAFERWR